ncbi:uncharacterized protein LOC135995844 isoform X1 [Caloenas nicobarica]|uniref:uncharacterized protein LOC135995844 isoform X1 n=1 Tax=Caloenas nicobarica TaxID=187106 RepID=UPI0032B78626
MIWTLEPDYHLWAHLAWILEPPRAGGEAVGPSRGGCSAPTHSQRGREASACQEVVTAACRKDVHLLCLSKKAIPTSSAGEAVARCRDPCPKQASCGMDNGNLQDEWTSQKRWGEADRRYWRKTQEKGHPSVFWIGRVSRSEEQEMQLHGGSTSSPATQVQVVTSVFTSIFGTVKVALGRKGNLFPAAAAQGAVNAATTADVHHFRGILVKIWNSSNQLRSL